MSKQTETLKLALESAAGLALEVMKKHRQMKGEYPMGMLGARAVEEIEAVFREMDEALADSALERMAENARELGLDYEPPCKTGSQCTSKCPFCESQHVPGWLHDYNMDRGAYGEQPAQQQKESEAVRVAWMAGYTEGEREAFEFTSPPSSKLWVGLSEEDRLDIWKHSSSIDGAINATEAKLREKNT